MDILNADFIKYETIRGEVKATEKEITEFSVEYGDILFQRSSETLEDIGRANVYLDQRSAVFGGFVIRGKKIADYNPLFFRYNLSSPNTRRRIIPMGAGAQHFNIGQEGLKQVSLNIPTNEEQQKIADLLLCIDERIATQRRLIEKLETLMYAIRRQVFQNLTQHQPLGNIVDIRKGAQINGSELLEVGKYHVMNGGVTPSGYLNECNTPADIISISEGGNSCGYVQFNDTPIWSGGHCYTLHPINEGIDYRYLYHFLKYAEGEIMKLRIGSGLPNIQKKDLSKFPIAYQAMPEQVKIRELLDAMELKIFNEEYILKLFGIQKSYLLSDMFM